MYKGGKIIASLIIFVAFLSLPFFINMGKANAGPDINLKTPTILALAPADQQCVESPEYMKANHMKLLKEWRAASVRDGQSVYINSQGKEFEISLQDTCLDCHSTVAEKATKAAAVATGVSNPAVDPSPQFCASCHDYNAVKPLCWTCHFEPKEATK
jgi:nitrate reductase cytochrome c-type subunit